MFCHSSNILNSDAQRCNTNQHVKEREIESADMRVFVYPCRVIIHKFEGLSAQMLFNWAWNFPIYLIHCQAYIVNGDAKFKYQKVFFAWWASKQCIRKNHKMEKMSFDWSNKAWRAINSIYLSFLFFFLSSMPVWRINRKYHARAVYIKRTQYYFFCRLNCIQSYRPS